MLCIQARMCCTAIYCMYMLAGANKGPQYSPEDHNWLESSLGVHLIAWWWLWRNVALHAKGSDGQKDVTSLSHHWELSAASTVHSSSQMSEVVQGCWQKGGISSTISLPFVLTALRLILCLMSHLFYWCLHLQYDSTSYSRYCHIKSYW